MSRRFDSGGLSPRRNGLRGRIEVIQVGLAHSSKEVRFRAKQVNLCDRLNRLGRRARLAKTNDNERRGTIACEDGERITHVHRLGHRGLDRNGLTGVQGI